MFSETRTTVRLELIGEKFLLLLEKSTPGQLGYKESFSFDFIHGLFLALISLRGSGPFPDRILGIKGHRSQMHFTSLVVFQISYKSIDVSVKLLL